MSPTQRSLKWLRDNGYTAGIVEKFNHYVKIRQDLFGIIDLVAMNPQSDLPIMGVQVTSGSNVSSHLQKALESPNLALWLASGGAFEVHGWRKVGKRGKRKLWALRRTRATLKEGQPEFAEVRWTAESDAPGGTA